MSQLLTTFQLSELLNRRFTWVDAEVRAGRLAPKLIAGRRVFEANEIEKARKLSHKKQKRLKRRTPQGARHRDTQRHKADKVRMEKV